MKILISGGTGFIGNHLIKRLAEEKHELTAIVRTSTDTGSLKKQQIKTFVTSDDILDLIAFMKQERFDGVIHLASLFLGQHQSQDVSELVRSNVLFSTLLLEAATKSQTAWFINTGTFWQHFENSDYSPVNLYAATKEAFETISKYYLETTPINFVTLQLSDTFGPADTRPKIFNLWLKAATSGEPLDMSPGEQLIDISYIDNVVNAYIQTIQLLSDDTEKKRKGSIFAVSSGEQMTLRQLAALFEKVTKTKLAINWGKKEYRTREVMRPWSKGKPMPGWQPQISLEEGIRRTFNSHD